MDTMFQSLLFVAEIYFIHLLQDICVDGEFVELLNTLQMKRILRVSLWTCGQTHTTHSEERGDSSLYRRSQSTCIQVWNSS